MAFNSQVDKSFKTLINKEFANPDRSFVVEFGANTLNINSGEVWSDLISSTPSTAVANGVAKLYDKFTLTPLEGFADKTHYFLSGSGFTPGSTPFDRPSVNPDLLQRNFISDKYGVGYTVELYDDNDTRIFTTDAIGWFFDYVTGILYIEDPDTSKYTAPYKVTIYQYTGRTVQSNITEGYSGSFSGSFQGDGSGLTNLPADSIVGLQLNQIADTTTTASVAGTGNIFNIERDGIDYFTIDDTGKTTLDTLTIQNDLIVQGTASFQETSNTTIADRFILLASGSTTPSDGGFVVQQGTQGEGELLGFDFQTNRWAFTSSFDASNSGFNPDLYIAGVLSSSLNDGTPNDNSIDARFEVGGNIYIGNDESIWMYS